jgi:outer membrane protein TolC
MTNASNQLEKDRLTLARIIGLAVDQDFALTDALGYHPLSGMTGETAVEEALRSRADLRSAETSVQAAALSVRAQKAQRLPVVSVTADTCTTRAAPRPMQSTFPASSRKTAGETTTSS